MINKHLLFAALGTMGHKLAFVSPGGDPSQGGAPPGGDPSAGGAPPPGGDPSGGGAPLPTGGDPSGGGAPPPGGGDTMPMGDPSGGAPPPPPPDAGGVGGGPGGGDMAAQVVQGVTQALQGSGLMGNKTPTAPKPDINTIATDTFQNKKLILHLFRHMGIEIPMDILDGPNRDPMTGAPAQGAGGGSVVAPGASAQQAGGGMNSAIKPIGPMAGAFPGGAPGGGGGGGMGKMSSDQNYERMIGQEISLPRLQSKAAAVAMLLRSRQSRVA